MARIWALLGLVLVWLGAALPAHAANERMDRLPRESFDVIAPDTRVQGERGDMRAWQRACRVGPTNWARRRIVDIAVQEWAFFGFQTIDASSSQKRLLPEGLVPEARNPLLKTPRIEDRFVRLGQSESARDMAATIAGYWTATQDGERAIAAQNRAWSAPGGRSVLWLQPWSAAFISWVMCEAGLGDMAQFARDVSHRVYVDQAIAARDDKNSQSAYVAYDSGEAPIAPAHLQLRADPVEWDAFDNSPTIRALQNNPALQIYERP